MFRRRWLSKKKTGDGVSSRTRAMEDRRWAMTGMKRAFAMGAAGIVISMTAAASVSSLLPGEGRIGEAGTGGREAEVRTAPQAKEQAGPEIDLGALLDKVAAYCRRLEDAALDFVCQEEIVETIDPSLDLKRPAMPIRSWTPVGDASSSMGETRGSIAIFSVKKIKRTLLYDYQCIRIKGEMTERRTLLREDKKKLNEPDAKLKTSVMLYETPLLGPVGVFSEYVRPHFTYAVVGREKHAKKPVIVVEAIPKPDAPPARDLYGKAWIDPATGDIVKIEWNDKRIGHFEVFEKRGEKYGLKPRVTMTSEFKIEKNGLRFPTSFVAEEVYLNARGRAFVRSTTAVEFKGFKFFTVETGHRVLR
jgi:hypothetical protein